MTDQVSDEVPEGKPYKGSQSFEVEDAALFYGREREAEQLIAQILSSRLALIHARSGAGKTSLLNARVIPGLEARGLIPIRVLPNNDPIDSVRVATLQYLFPPPAAEVAAIDRACQTLGCGRAERLSGLLERYRELDEARPEKRRLLMPLVSFAAPPSLALPDYAKVTPCFCRVLRSSMSLDSYGEHLLALGQGTLASLGRLDLEMPVGALQELLQARQLRLDYEELLETLYVPLPGLRPFFENLVDVYGPRRTKLSLVLILDQFEELFTRFVDPGPLAKEGLVGLQDWRLRPEFFRQLQILYEDPDVERESTVAGERKLPLRFVISMRDEFLANLDPVRQFVPDLDRWSYHLGLLSRDSAREAIEEPARLFGYRYSGDCYASIIGELSIEGRFVEPVHVQILCDKLWSERGRELAGPVHDEQDLPEIELATFEKLQGTRGILRTFFLELLARLDGDDRLEVLEMLEPLFTPRGTRNIVSRDQLLSLPFRNRELRERLLVDLERRNIVRREHRLGGEFFEITHEFLIPAILGEIRDTSDANAEFRSSLRSLELAQDKNWRDGPRSQISADAVRILAANRRRLVLGYRGSELLLRAAILEGLKREEIRPWVELVAQSGPVPPANILIGKASDQDLPRDPFSADELQVINRGREGLKLGDLQFEQILRSELLKAADADRGDICYWTRRVLLDGA